MSTGEHFATDIIRGLKTQFGVESDDALAAKIGVAKSTVATWRRRGGIPSKAVLDIEGRFGLTLNDLQNKGREELRSYLLRQIFYYVLLSAVQQNYVGEHSERDDAVIADDCAVIEPFLKRAIVRAASAEGYQGVRGASSFLLNLRADPLMATSLMQEAITDRKRALGFEDGMHPPTNTPTNP
jgi:hypothetical protein